MKKRLGNAALAAVSGGLLVYLIAQTDVGKMASVLSKANPIFLAAGAVMMYAQFYFSAVRWRVLLAAAGISVPLQRLVNSYLASNFISSFLPSRYSADIYRTYDLATHSQRPFDSAAAVFMERLTGLLVLAGLGLVASLFCHRIVPVASLSLYIVAVYAALLVGLWLVFNDSAYRALDRVLAGIGPEKLRRIVKKFHAAVAQYRGRTGMFVRIGAVSLLFYGQAFLIVQCSAWALGVHVPFLYVAQVVPVVFVLEALPISINGLGVREGAFTFFLTKLGVAAEEAVAISLILLFLRVFYALVGGVIFIGGRLRPALQPAKSPALTGVSAGSGDRSLAEMAE
jgi:glycosyltransferase 2 family protein